VTESIRRRWRGVEPDVRQADRRQRLLDVALELLGTEGAGAVTVRGVCAGAGLHSRYFYENFDDVDALLVALFDDVASGALARAQAAGTAAGSDPREVLRASLAAMASFLTEDPRRIRLLVLEAVDSPALNRRRHEVLHTIARLGEEAGYATYGPPPPGEEIARIGAHLVAGGLAELFLAWLDGEFTVSLDRLIDDTVELIMAVQDGVIRVASSRAPARRRPSR
jgi:AcrR family transcriptional regulator